MPTEWTMLRIKRSTWERLKAIKAKMDQDESRHEYVDLSTQDRYGVTLDSVVNVLIDRDMAHRERANRKKPVPKQ